MSSMGGNREMERVFVAERGFLHFGQFLHDKVSAKRNGRGLAYQASPPSSVSGLMSSSIHWLSVTEVIFFPLGTGKLRYIKVLYVVLVVPHVKHLS